MSYTHYRVESPSGTTRLSGRVNGTLSITYGGQTVESIASATDFTKYCSNKMMKSNIIIGNSTIYCGDMIMPNDLRIITSTSDYGTYQIITSSGTWVCPADVTSINVFCVGGGGPGGYRGDYPSSESVRCGGGGGGGYCTNTSVSVTPGTSYTIVIGAGAPGSSNSFTNDQRGGTTSFLLNGTTLASSSGGEAPPLNTYYNEYYERYFHDQRAGGNGGAGGGAGGAYSWVEGQGASWSYAGAGGSNGANGGSVYASSGGTGQGSSAVYSPITGVYYSGGGGGGSGVWGSTHYEGAGGNYGGGAGCNQYGGTDAVPNSGGGGGGSSLQQGKMAKAGASGIMIISW